MDTNRARRMPPKVSVLITAHNEEENIEGAVRSVLGQSYPNLEVIAISDGSEDTTVDMLEQFTHEDLRIYDQDKRGRVESLNRGVDLAAGAFIAILDADDRSLPGRIEKQARFLDEHQTVGVVGSSYVRRDMVRGERYIRNFPTHDREIRKAMAKCVPIAHSSAMIRKSSICDVNGYAESDYGLEDMDLWIRIARDWRLANIPEPLILRNIRQDSHWRSVTNRHLRNARLARLTARAVHELSLPFYYYVFPLARLAYSGLPVPLKRVTRRLLSSIEEQDLEDGSSIPSF